MGSSGRGRFLPLLVKQHLREAESELVRKRARLEAVVAEEKQSREVSKRLASEIKRLEEDVSLAIDGDKEELARFAIKKLLGLKRRSEQVERRGKQLREECAELEKELERQEQELSELRVRVKAFLARAHAGEQNFRFIEPVVELVEPVEPDEIEIELLRRRQRRGEKEAL